MRLLAVLLALLAPLAARAKCARYAAWSYPESGGRLPSNGRVVLEGSGDARALVERIEELGPALTGPEGQIPLRQLEANAGADSVSQAVLAPVRPLRPGATYRLTLTRPDPKLDRELLAELTALRWKAEGPLSAGAPRWAEPPSAAGGSFKELGCGPSVHAVISARFKDERITVLRAEVAGPRGEPRRYLVPVREGKVEIGHGMCSGPFTLEPGVKYRVSLTAIDAAGNEARAPGEAVEVVGPAPSKGE